MRFRLLPKDSNESWTAYLWLIYLSFFLAVPWFKPHVSPLEWVATGAGAAVFLALYFRAYWVEGRTLLGYIAAIVLLGVLYTPFNSGAGAFFIYAAAFAGSVGTSRDGIRVLVGIELVTILTMLLSHAMLVNAVWPVVFVAMIGAINMHYAQVGRANARLRLAQDEIERLAKLAERERIARDLHDLLGHTLSLIILKSELATKLAERDPRRAAQEIGDVERISREALAQVRQAVRGYRSEGISTELGAAREMLHAANIELTADIQPVALSAIQEAVLSLALREAVTNVVRHSAARRCTVTLATSGIDIVLTIADDGRGGASGEGSGLTGMRERIAALGGSVTREGSEGTLLTIAIPAASTLERSA